MQRAAQGCRSLTSVRDPAYTCAPTCTVPIPTKCDNDSLRTDPAAHPIPPSPTRRPLLAPSP